MLRVRRIDGIEDSLIICEERNNGLLVGGADALCSSAIRCIYPALVFP